MLTIGLTITALAGAAILIIGVLYVLRPQMIAASFGLPGPTPAAAVPWLRLKGIRDIATGLVAAALLLTAPASTIGWAVLGFTVIPAGDCASVLHAGGRRTAAWGIHAATAASMLIGVAMLWAS